MITLTALNDLRCSIRPELIVSVDAGSSTMVSLKNGLVLAVRESPDEIRRLLTVSVRDLQLAAEANGNGDGSRG